MNDIESVELDRIRLSRESSTRRGGILADPRTWWVMGGSIIVLLGLLLAALLKELTAGFIILAVLIFICLFLVGAPVFDGFTTVPIAKLYRRWYFRHQKRLGRDYHLSRAVSIGERSDPMDRGPGPTVMEALGPITLAPFETPDGVLGVVSDEAYDTVSSVIKISGYPTLSHDQTALRDRRLAWADLINLAGSNGLYRFTWQDETVIGEDIDPDALTHAIRTGSGLAGGPPELQDIFRKRSIQMGENLPIHLEYLVLSLSRAIDWKKTKKMGGVHNVLYDRTVKLQDRLLSSGTNSPYGIADATILSYNDLVKVWHRRLDPRGAKQLEQHQLPPGELLNELHAWPDTFDLTDPYRYRVGKTWHRGLAISNFSVHMVPTAAFWRLLEVPVPKVVTVTSHPVEMRESINRVVQETNLAVSQSQLQEVERGRATAFQLGEAARLQRDETEMAASGNYDLSFSCLIDVMGSSLRAVDENHAEVMNAIGGANFLVRELEYEQFRSLEAALMAGRGLQPSFFRTKG